MDDRKQTYLNELIRWGNETKNSLPFSGNEEEWKAQIDQWQAEVSQHLNQGQQLTEEKMSALKAEGERIFFGIKEGNEKEQQTASAVPYSKHQLPPLPYAYDALEPYISEQIMRLHHDNHHQSYVDGLNRAERELYLENPQDATIKHWLREQAFNGSGHYLHTIFWYNMTPDSSKKPLGKIREQIDKDFGSWKEFKQLFTKTATSVEGVGWAVLLWSPRSRKLAVQSFEKHQMFQIADTIPILVLDMWEHAYYLQYQTDKDAYIRNWWNVVNWRDVNDRFEKAQKLKWHPY